MPNNRSKKQASGLNITIGKNDKPIILKCGDEEVSISYSERCSANSIMVRVVADKDKVHISTPHTIHRMGAEIDKVLKENKAQKREIERLLKHQERKDAKL